MKTNIKLWTMGLMTAALLGIQLVLIYCMRVMAGSV